MSFGGEDTRAPEIVIVRRRGHEEDHPPHGGIWKIAYADFMTAMMAFFLVMWLINTADNKTIGQIATYFNPIKLTDNIPGPKGVHETLAEEPLHEQKGSRKASSRETDPKAPEADPKHSEQALFEDPYGILAKLAENYKAAVKNAKASQQGGAALRDAFDPDFAPSPPRAPERVADTAADAIAPDENDGSGKAAELTPVEMEKGGAQEPEKTPPDKGQAVDGAAEIRAALREAFSTLPPNTIPSVQVTQTPEGVLISLTDQFDFEMFAIGSAEPRPGLIAAMDKIAQLLMRHQGNVVVRGHTDGRPYKSKIYDNWRLSSARAHMAHYILVHGGLSEARIERIEGYGATSLRMAQNPEAAANRRIEILLRTTTP